MTFDLFGLLRFLGRWLATLGRRPSRWTLRRGLILVAFLVVYPLLQAAVWLGFAVDALVFRRSRRQPVEAPLFIVGNPRSGTTFLHRLLARDTDRFTSMEMWEILFCPSIAQRRAVAALGALERRLGRPVGRLFDAMERRWHQLNVMHEVSLREPEEDDYLLLHVWSALTTGLSCGLLDEASPYVRYDQQVAPSRRRRDFAFYRRCVERHLSERSRGGQRSLTYLAKNPALTPKLQTLWQTFPDARVVCLVRDPLEAIPSYLSMMVFSWRAVGIRLREGEVPDELREFLLDMAGHWYRYPLRFLDAVPESQLQLVRYDELVTDPATTVRRIYDRFGLEVGERYEGVLQEQSARASRYRSRHDYGLEALGLDRESLLERYADLFERFGFDDRAGPEPDRRAVESRGTTSPPSPTVS